MSKTPHSHFNFREGLVVNRGQLAELLGVSKPTVDAYVKRGLPFIKRGGRGSEYQFKAAQALNWYREHVEQAPPLAHVKNCETIQDLERRLLIARVQKAEIEAAEAMGEVIHYETHLTEKSRYIAALRATHKGMAARLLNAFGGRRFSSKELSKMLDEELKKANAKLPALLRHA